MILPDEDGCRAEKASFRSRPHILVGVIGCQLGGKPFQLGTHLISFADLSRLGNPNDGTLIRQVSHEALRFQYPQSFANGRPANGKPLCQCFLAQARTRCEFAGAAS